MIAWAKEGLIPDQWEDTLDLASTPSTFLNQGHGSLELIEIEIGGFLGSYQGNVKEPDACFIPIRNGVPAAFPSVVFESAWAE